MIKKEVVELINRGGFIELPSELRGDKEVVMEAVRKDGSALEFVNRSTA